MRLRLLFIALLLAASTGSLLSQHTLSITPEPDGQGETNSPAVRNKPEPGQEAREALQVKEILQSNGKVYISWHDPYPQKRTYYLQLEEITTLKGMLKKQIQYLDKATSKSFKTDEIMKKRASLEAEIAKAEKKNRVISAWHPMKQVIIRDLSNGLKQAEFAAQPGARVMTIRINSVMPDSTVSPFRSMIRIPLQPKVGFFARYGWYVAGCVVFISCSGFLLWSLWKRGVLPGFRKVAPIKA